MNKAEFEKLRRGDHVEYDGAVYESTGQHSNGTDVGIYTDEAKMVPKFVPFEECKLVQSEEKIKCYELDFGDTTNPITQDPKAIIEWIDTDIGDMEEGGEPIAYEITIKMLTQKEIDDLPEWS